MPEQKRIRRSFRAVEGDWRRADIHLHTPASADWLEPGVTFLQWLQKAESKGLDIVAITDHNTVEGVAKMRAEVERLAWLEANDRLRPQERRDLDEYRRLGDKILVLPGFEFTATFGFHILGIFPPETPLRKLELLLLRLNLPVDRLGEGAMDMGPTTDVLTAYRLINEAGGLVVAAHANSTHGVALQGMSFGGQTRIAFTQDPNLHALEVTDMESESRRASARFFDGSKPEYPRRMHVCQGSDAHRLTRDPRDKNRLGVGDRVTEILLPDVSYEAFRAVFEGNDFERLRPYRPPAEVPFDHVQSALEQGPNIIQSFHEGVSRDGGRLQKVLADVVAFANTYGGTVYVGVASGQKGPARGVENPDIEVLQLKREIERNITPPIDASVDALVSQNVPVLRVRVPNGSDKPYALGQTRIYVREEGETNEAVRDELVQLVLSSQRGEALPAVAEQPAGEDRAEAPTAALPQPAGVSPRMLRPAVESVAAMPVVSQAEGGRLPAIGVEIAAMEERKGARYFAIRDLRNGNVVQNVTSHSARKLWSYAINQHLTNPVDAARVTWRGELGLWQAARRAKKLRYDLVLRQRDGSMRVFYGVTADGMTGPWAQFLLAEDRPEGEAASVVPLTAIIDMPEDEPSLDLAHEDDILAPADETNGVAEGNDEAGPSKRRRRGGRGRGRGKASTAPAIEDQPSGAPEPALAEASNGGRDQLPPASKPGKTAEPVVTEAKKPAARSRGGRAKPKSDTAPVQARVAAEPVPTPAPVVQGAPADAAQAAAKPKSRARKPQVQPVDAPIAPAPVIVLEPAAVEAPKKPARRRTPKQVVAEPEPPPAPEPVAEAKPKPRSRRKPVTGAQ